MSLQNLDQEVSECYYQFTDSLEQEFSDNHQESGNIIEDVNDLVNFLNRKYQFDFTLSYFESGGLMHFLLLEIRYLYQNGSWRGANYSIPVSYFSFNWKQNVIRAWFCAYLSELLFSLVNRFENRIKILDMDYNNSNFLIRDSEDVACSVGIFPLQTLPDRMSELLAN